MVEMAIEQIVKIVIIVLVIAVVVVAVYFAFRNYVIPYFKGLGYGSIEKIILSLI